jgi:hypothetical protein
VAAAVCVLVVLCTAVATWRCTTDMKAVSTATPSLADVSRKSMPKESAKAYVERISA